MGLKTNNAEGGTAGAAIAGSQSGSGDGFDTVVNTGSPSATYSGIAAHGSLGYAVSGTAGDVFSMRWSGSAVTAAAFRIYMRLVTLPATYTDIVQFRDTSGGQNAAISMNNVGNLQIKDAAGAPIKTFSNVMSLNTWYRVELQLQEGVSSTTGTISGAYYLLDNASPVETAYSSTSVNAGTTTHSSVMFGKLSSSPANLSFNFDDIAWNYGSATPLGPVSAPSNLAPTCNAGTDQPNLEPYTSITLTGTDNDSDGTVTGRTWRQVSGSPSVTLSGSGTTRTYIAPGTLLGASLVFGYTVTDNSGASSTESTVTHTILSATERAVVGGVEVPMATKVVSGGGLI